MSSVYQGTQEPSRWVAVTDGLRNLLRARFGILYSHDYVQGRAGLNTHSPFPACVLGIEDSAVSSYVRHYSRCNVWIGSAERYKPGEVALSSKLYEDDRLPRTEFYNDWLKPLDLFYAMGAAIVRDGRRDVRISFVRSKSLGPFRQPEIRLFRELVAHFCNACLIASRLSEAAVTAQASLAALEMLSCGVLLLDGRGRCLHANRAARELSERTRAFALGPQGTLVASDQGARRRLDQMISVAANSSTSLATSRGAPLICAGEQGDVQLLVAPLPVAADTTPSGARAIVFCSDCKQAQTPNARMLKDRFGLTQAEIRIAEALLDGKAPKEIAYERSVSIHTVRTQIAALTAKTGARRQIDLVRLLLSLPAFPPREQQMVHVRPVTGLLPPYQSKVRS